MATQANVQTDLIGGTLRDSFSTGTKTISVASGGTFEALAGAILSIADNLIPFNAIVGHADILSKTAADSYYQPLEDQRLSTGDTPTFLTVTATNQFYGGYGDTIINTSRGNWAISGLVAANISGSAATSGSASFTDFFASSAYSVSGITGTFLQTDGDGSGLTGVVAASGWPTLLSDYTNDTGFMVNAGTGVDSLALGSSATAAADYSLALGNNSTSSGYASVAVGSAIASGNSSAAFGLHTVASGDHSEAFGWGFTNSTDFSLEIGYTDFYKLQISSAGFNFIGPAITLNSATPWQTPLTAGTDYLTPSGDGSLLTGIVAASGWPTALSRFTNDVGFVTSGWPTALSSLTNDVGFLTSADMGSQSVSYAYTSGSAGQSTMVYGTFGDTLQNTNVSQWTMSGDLQVGNGGSGCEFLSPVYFGLRSNPYRVDASGNAYLYTLDIGSGEVTIDTGGNYNSTYGSVTASHFYGDASGLTMGIGGPALNVFPNASAPISSDPGTPGQMYFDDNYTYRCFATSDWRRNALNGGTGYITY